MYQDINQAFQYKPDDGIRAVIAAQYPGDRADVDFARCLNAIVPGAKTLPSSKRIHMVPNVLTTTLDSGYTLTSNRVKRSPPEGSDLRDGRDDDRRGQTDGPPTSPSRP